MPPTKRSTPCTRSGRARHPRPLPCLRPPFSLTLKGTLDGHEALLTARGQTAAEFRRNLQAIRGLLDAPQVPQAGPTLPNHGAEGWCSLHNVGMKENVKDGRRWFSHRHEGQWCKGK